MKIKLLLLSIALSTASLYSQQSEYSTINKPVKPISRFSVNYEWSSTFTIGPSTNLCGIEFMCHRSTNDKFRINARGGFGKFNFYYPYIVDDVATVSYFAVNMLIGKSNSFEFNTGLLIEHLEPTWALITVGYRETIDDLVIVRTGLGTTGLYLGIGINF